MTHMTHGPRQRTIQQCKSSAIFARFDAAFDVAIAIIVVLLVVTLPMREIAAAHRVVC